MSERDKNLSFVPDMDGDGDRDWMDVAILNSIIEDIEKKKKEEEEIDNDSSEDVPDYTWRESCEDGSDYDIFPEDYETEEEYLEALEEAKYYEDNNEDDSDDYDVDCAELSDDEDYIMTEPVSSNRSKTKLSDDLPIFYGYSEEEKEIMANDYVKLKKRIEESPSDLLSRNRLISLLFSRVYRANFEQQFHYWVAKHDFSTLSENKNRVLALLLDITECYRKREYGSELQKDKMEYFAVLLEAELSLCLGDFVRSMSSYQKFLSLPIVRRAIIQMQENMYWTDTFAFDDLEVVLRVVHNMASIYQMTGFEDKVKKLYTKYNKLVKIYYSSQSGLAAKLPNQADSLMEKAEILCGFTDSDIIYSIASGHYYFPNNDKDILDVIYQHPEERSGDDLDCEMHWQYDGFSYTIHDGIYDLGFATFDEYTIDIEKQQRMIEALF